MGRRGGSRRFIGLLALGLGLVTQPATAAADVSSSGDIVVVVAAENPVRSLSLVQLEDIFLGRTNRFPNGRSAVPIDQSDGSAARADFYTRILGRSLPQIKAHWSKIIFTGRGRPPRHVPNGLEVRKLLADDARAIGYLERGLVDDSVRVVGIEEVE
jgi:ABC-type phosphate transport system substrate-binding protein